jgi:hypothetical protein
MLLRNAFLSIRSCVVDPRVFASASAARPCSNCVNATSCRPILVDARDSTPLRPPSPFVRPERLIAASSLAYSVSSPCHPGSRYSPVIPGSSSVSGSCRLPVSYAIHSIPPGMHVCVSTDSNYVKTHITKLIPIRQGNGWKNAPGEPAPNKTSWQKLVEVLQQHTKVEWTWVKAHSGILPNECADMLVTKVVRNKMPRQGTQ